jgi:acyl-CoA reductase-like NAD-dependent aldehyde dehydrogenase
MNPGEPTRMEIPIRFPEQSDVTSAVAKALSGVRSAQARWARTAMEQRLELVRQLRHAIARHGEGLAQVAAQARECSVAEALVTEVIPLADACRFLEREAKKILSSRRLGRRGLPLWLGGVRTEVRREPHGVVLIIGPGNYPLLLSGVQMLQALVAGNGVLLKPGSGAGIGARALFDLMVSVGFDSQLVAVLPEPAAAARAAILARPDKVVFTGSAETGQSILAQLAPHMIPATMELSGCDAVIIRSDADLDLAVKALVFGMNLNRGATCLAPKRVFVSTSRATELEGRLVQSLRGHQIEAPGTPKLRSLIGDAIARGAHLIAGDIGADGSLRLPLVLGGVTPASQLLREDVFAPVLVVVTVADDREAILRANDCPYALTASVFSRNELAAREIATQVRAGLVTINDLILPAADARTPFGGRGRSGFGVTQGAEGLLEMTVTKVITVTRGKFRPAFEPLRTDDAQLFASYLTLSHGRGWRTRWVALNVLLKSIRHRNRHSQETT